MRLAKKIISHNSYERGNRSSSKGSFKKPPKCLYFNSPHKQGITSIQLYGNTLFSASSDGMIKMWDIRTEKHVNSLLDITKMEGILTFKTDGVYLAAGYMDGYLRLWNITNGKLLYRFENPDNDNEKEIVHPLTHLLMDADHLFCGYSNGKIRLFDKREGTLLATLDDIQKPISKLIYHEGYLISLYQDGRIRIWECDDLNSGISLSGHNYPISSCVMDTTLLVTGDKKGFTLIQNWKTKDVLKTFQAHTSEISAMAMSSDWILTGSKSGDINMWDRQTLTLSATFNCGSSIKKLNLRYPFLSCILEDNTLIIRNLIRRINAYHTSLDPSSHPKYGKQIHQCPTIQILDSTRVIIGYSNGTLSLFKYRK